MQTLYIFCLIWSVVVLAADNENPATTEPSTSNGLQCPTCQNLTSGSCEDKLDFCHGEEKLCVDSTGNIQNEGKETAFVTKGCVTQLALQALLGTENVKTGTTYTLTSVKVTTAQVGSTETPTHVASNPTPESSENPEDKSTAAIPTESTPEIPTESTPEIPTESTPRKPTESTPRKPTEAASEKTTSKGSPHISRGLSFALWLPIMSSVLWMTILS